MCHIAVESTSALSVLRGLPPACVRFQAVSLGAGCQKEMTGHMFGKIAIAGAKFVAAGALEKLGLTFVSTIYNIYIYIALLILFSNTVFPFKFNASFHLNTISSNLTPSSFIVVPPIIFLAMH